jgi:hypothetical protein
MFGQEFIVKLNLEQNMQKFATACALAVSASAVDTTKGTMQMSIDNFTESVQSIPQGDGKYLTTLY